MRGEGFERVAHLRPFPLPGGDAAAREPRRSLAGALWEIGEFGRARELFASHEFRVLERMLERGVNTVRTTSAGRLIDAAAAALGLRAVSSYEAQAAMMLEFAADGWWDGSAAEPASVGSSGVVDWEPWLRDLVDGPTQADDVGRAAARFHRKMVGGIISVALATGIDRVVLSGGCFQNRLLLEGAVAGLRQAGMCPFWHQRVPPNDGGVALGQAVAAW